MDEVKQEKTVETHTHPMPGMCNCGWHGTGMYSHRNRLTRLLIGLAVLLVVFLLGFHLGHCHEGFRDGEFGPRGGHYRGMGPGMMYFQQGDTMPNGGPVMMQPQASTTPY